MLIILCSLPIIISRRLFPTDGTSYNIGIMVNDITEMDAAIAEAKGTFRPIRKLAIDEANNFYIDKSDSIAEVFKSALGSITTAAAFIGLITLLGAAIGLMNIMLVAVSERTREIGLIKAIGGKSKSIRAQFLFESIFISLDRCCFRYYFRCDHWKCGWIISAHRFCGSMGMGNYRDCSLFGCRPFCRIISCYKSCKA